jgi:proteasome lid subunit RPN8/RPN11
MEVFPVHPDQYFKVLQPFFWNDTVEKEFQDYALDNYPNESCAIFINNKLEFLENINEAPGDHFEFSLDDNKKVLKALGLIHSHPNGLLLPSESDMRSQMSLNIPFGLVTVGVDSVSRSIWWSDDLLSFNLEGRPFVHGIFDCYSLIRAYYKQSRSVVLKDYARNVDWWEGKENLYVENFQNCGFKQISNGDTLQEGDVILMAVNTNMPAHAAIYLGNDLILHHLSGRISRKDRYHTWKKFITSIVRYG